MIMEKTIEELILQELKEIKGAVNRLDKRMEEIGRASCRERV